MLGGVVLVASIAFGAAANRALLAFVVGAFVVAFAALADRRGLLLRNVAEPQPLPAEAVVQSRLRTVARAAYPSTLGVAVLAVIAFAADEDVLGALLGGAVAGLGVASGVGLMTVLAWERKRGVRLYNGERGGRYFR